VVVIAVFALVAGVAVGAYAERLRSAEAFSKKAAELCGSAAAEAAAPAATAGPSPSAEP
jgi:hypothetical protein